MCVKLRGLLVCQENSGMMIELHQNYQALDPVLCKVKSVIVQKLDCSLVFDN
jgi:hypothetical protein